MDLCKKVFGQQCVGVNLPGRNMSHLTGGNYGIFFNSRSVYQSINQSMFIGDSLGYIDGSHIVVT